MIIVTNGATQLTLTSEEQWVQVCESASTLPDPIQRLCETGFYEPVSDLLASIRLVPKTDRRTKSILRNLRTFLRTCESDAPLVLFSVETVENYNPNQPRDSHGRFGSGGGGGGFPSGGKGLRALKSLGGAGGSTGAQIMEDKDGNKFIMKTADGDKADHIKSEFAAEKAYEAAGVPVPKSQLYENADTGQVTKLSQFIEGKTLDKLKGAEAEAAEKQVQKHFAVDAALGNWDVVGLTKDNILVGKDGTAYRIDAGGALSFRASGKPKGAVWDNEGNEINTMRDPGKNLSAAQVFGKMTDSEVAASVQHLQANKWKIQDTLIDHGNKSDAEKVVARSNKIVSDSVAKEAADFKKSADKSFKKASTKSDTEANLSKVAASSAAAGHLGDGDRLKNYIAGKVKGQDLVLKQEHLDKIKFLNPQGIQDGKFYVPAIGVPTDPKYVQFIKNLENALPVGTEIKKIVVPKNAATDPNMTFSKGKMVPITSVTGTTSNKASTPQKAKPTPKPVKSYDTLDFGKPSGMFDISSHAGKKLPASQMENQNKWYEALSGNEQSAISSWQGSATAIRHEVTANPPPPPKGTNYGEKEAAAFCSAISKGTAVQGTVYRGVHGEYAEEQVQKMIDTGVGGTWSDTAPHCMSRNTKTAVKFTYGNGLILQIETKTGRSIERSGNGFSGEQEVTGMPNTQYRIKDIKIKHSTPSIGPTGDLEHHAIVNHYVTLEEI